MISKQSGFIMLDCVISLGILVCVSSVVLMYSHVFPNALRAQLYQLNEIERFENAHYGISDPAITTSPYAGTPYVLMSFKSTNGISFLSLVEQ